MGLKDRVKIGRNKNPGFQKAGCYRRMDFGADKNQNLTTNMELCTAV